LVEQLHEISKHIKAVLHSVVIVKNEMKATQCKKSGMKYEKTQHARR